MLYAGFTVPVETFPAFEAAFAADFGRTLIFCSVERKFTAAFVAFFGFFTVFKSFLAWIRNCTYPVSDRGNNPIFCERSRIFHGICRRVRRLNVSRFEFVYFRAAAAWNFITAGVGILVTSGSRIVLIYHHSLPGDEIVVISPLTAVVVFAGSADIARSFRTLIRQRVNCFRKSRCKS